MVHFFRLRLYLGIENVSCLPVAMDCKNGHGLKREKIGPTF